MAKDTDHIISLLQAKRRRDPKGFRKFLPDVADMLPEPRRRSVSRSPFGLTGKERSFHCNGLEWALEMLGKGDLAKCNAVKGLHHYAILVRDNAFYNEIKDGDFKALVKAAVGKSPGSFRAKTTFSLGKGGLAVERVSALRGVHLDLDGERRLVSITIHPGKVKEHRRLMKIVGIGSDSKSDVATCHDHYLATRSLHG